MNERLILSRFLCIPLQVILWDEKVMCSKVLSSQGTTLMDESHDIFSWLEWREGERHIHIFIERHLVVPITKS